jgi:hypothetical protein
VVADVVCAVALRGVRGDLGALAAGGVAAPDGALVGLPLGVDAQGLEGEVTHPVAGVVEGVADPLEVTEPAAGGLAAVEVDPAGEQLLVLLLAALHLVVELVGVLDEGLVALQVLHREAVEPDVDVGALGVVEGLDEVGPHRLKVVEEHLAPLAVGVAEGDHVQEVVLPHAHVDEHLQHVGHVLHVPAVEHDVDVHDGTSVVHREPEALHLLLEGALHAHQGVVDARVGAVQREGDLVEARVEAALQEGRVGEHPPVGDGLDLSVTRELPQADEVHVARVHRGLAPREDEPLGALARAVEDLRLHLVCVTHVPVVGERVEAEDAVVVAVEGEPHPVALLVRRLLVLDDLRVDGLRGDVAGAHAGDPLVHNGFHHKGRGVARGANSPGPKRSR